MAEMDSRRPCGPHKRTIERAQNSKRAGSTGDACCWRATRQRSISHDPSPAFPVHHAIDMAVLSLSTKACAGCRKTAGDLPTAAVGGGERAAGGGEEVELALEFGAKVTLHSLTATEHNGKHGQLLEFDSAAGRWGVQVEGKKMAVRPVNLKVLPGTAAPSGGDTLQQKQLLKCAKCHFAYFCSRECQVSSWAAHKHACAKLRSGAALLPDSGAAPGRALPKISKLRRGVWSTRSDRPRQLQPVPPPCMGVRRRPPRQARVAALPAAC